MSPRIFLRLSMTAEFIARSRKVFASRRASCALHNLHTP